VKVMHEYRDEELAQALDELPVPATSADFYTRLRGRITQTRLRQHRMPGRRLVAAAALVGVALVVGGFAGAEFAGSTRAATSTPVPAFTPALGWTTVETTAPLPAPNPPNPIAWAANLSFDAKDLVTAWPHPPLQNLPPDGIVISVDGPSEGPFNKQARIVKPPYRVEDMFFWASADAAAHAASTADNYQGQPAPNVSYYWISAPTGPDQGIGISVWMGRNDPTLAMKAAADEELARLTLPS
jgi:hypothetical protein